MSKWQPIETAPKDGSCFDVWCVDPNCRTSKGVRFTDVQMRGDNSGFGFLVYLENDAVEWQYLDNRNNGIFPEWEPTHWMPLPEPPKGDNK